MCSGNGFGKFNTLQMAEMKTVAVNQESSTTVGHLPKKISKVCSLFLRRGGSIEVVVSGRRRYSSDLQLEVPCKLLFRASSSKEMDNLKKLSCNH